MNDVLGNPVAFQLESAVDFAKEQVSVQVWQTAKWASQQFSCRILRTVKSVPVSISSIRSSILPNRSLF